jgi:hypothetical protein
MLGPAVLGSLGVMRCAWEAMQFIAVTLHYPAIPGGGKSMIMLAASG